MDQSVRNLSNRTALLRVCSGTFVGRATLKAQIAHVNTDHHTTSARRARGKINTVKSSRKAVLRVEYNDMVPALAVDDCRVFGVAPRTSSGESCDGDVFQR